jgi:hypothetical protein
MGLAVRVMGPAIALLAGCAGEPSARAPVVSTRAAVSHVCVGAPDRTLVPPAPFDEASVPRRAPSPVVAAPARATAGKTVVISVDGLRPDAIFAAPAPNLLALACRGAFSWRARTVTPTVTLPSHASMMSGYLPEQHLLFHDHLRPGYIATPTLMEVATKAGQRVVVVVGKDKLIQLIPPGTVQVYEFSPGDDEVAAAAAAHAARGFDLMFVHFPMVDYTGHGYGWMSDPYLSQVVKTDAAVGRLLAALGADVTVIVSADHGGKGFVHWTGHPEDVQIPWIIAGPGIRAGHPLRAAISTVDTAATAAAVLGLQLSPYATGRAVDEAFVP